MSQTLACDYYDIGYYSFVIAAPDQSYYSFDSVNYMQSNFRYVYYAYGNDYLPTDGFEELTSGSLKSIEAWTKMFILIKKLDYTDASISFWYTPGSSGLVQENKLSTFYECYSCILEP